MIVGSRFAVPDDYLAAADRPRSATRWRFADGACRTNGRWPFRWSSLAELFDFTRDHWPAWTHALSYSTPARVRSVGIPPQPTFVWMTRHSAGMRLIAQAVHPPRGAKRYQSETTDPTGPRREGADIAEERVATERRADKPPSVIAVDHRVSSIDASDRLRLGRFGGHIEEAHGHYAPRRPQRRHAHRAGARRETEASHH